MQSPSTGLAQQRLEAKDAVDLLAALAQPSRLEVFRLLVRYLPYGLAAGDAARLLAVPQNTLSNHLSILERAGLILSRREGRSIIYAANKDLPLRLATFLTEDCCQASGQTCALDLKPFPEKREASMANKTYNVLVLCTGNSARSIIAEAILMKEGARRIRAFSAGSRPKGQANAYAIALLKELGYDTAALRSKSWEEFSGPAAPKMDFILTVCDAAAGETCPFWPGHRRPLGHSRSCGRRRNGCRETRGLHGNLSTSRRAHYGLRQSGDRTTRPRNLEGAACRHRRDGGSHGNGLDRQSGLKLRSRVGRCISND